MCESCQAHVPASPEPAPCPEAERLRELAELVADQVRDDADDHAPRHRREIPVTDLAGRTSVREGRHDHNTGRDRRAWHVLRMAVDHRCHPGAWRAAADQAMDDAAAAAVRSGGENRAGRLGGARVPTVLVGVGMPWDGRHAMYRPEGGPCPVCQDGELPATWLCLCCHATKQDPRRFPMQDQRRGRGKAKRKTAKVKREAAKAQA